MFDKCNNMMCLIRIKGRPDVLYVTFAVLHSCLDHGTLSCLSILACKGNLTCQAGMFSVTGNIFPNSMHQWILVG